MVSTRRLLIAVICLVAVADRDRLAGADPPERHHGAETLVERLGHDSYQSRARARRDLLASGPTADVRAALLSGLTSESLEVRQNSLEILQHFELSAFGQQLDRLTNPDVAPAEIRIAGWQRFAQLAGTGYWSRRLYSRIAQQHANVLRQLDRGGSHMNSVEHFIARTDPYQIGRNDAVRWALLLFCDSANLDLGRPDLSPRILDALSHSGVGPNQTMPADREVLQRLIGHWVAAHPTTGSVRSQMIVAMRYECHSVARTLADRTLASRSASASAQATAMLCASVLGRDDLSLQLQRRLYDERTAHEWQLIPSRKTKIRTQVRDIALALLLHHRDLDPREMGFWELQADPLLVYRDHSLGFANDEQRAAAHAKGRLRLGL